MIEKQIQSFQNKGTVLFPQLIVEDISQFLDYSLPIYSPETFHKDGYLLPLVQELAINGHLQVHLPHGADEKIAQCLEKGTGRQHFTPFVFFVFVDRTGTHHILFSHI